MFDRVDEFLKDVAAAFNDAGQRIERTFGFPGVAPFEIPQAIDLKLFPTACGANDFGLRELIGRSDIAIQADDGPCAVRDLLFVTVRGGLDLGTLIAQFDGGEHAPDTIERTKFVEDGALDDLLELLHPG